MAEFDPDIKRQALDIVQSDSAIVGAVASIVSTALGLERVNQTLGRKVVRRASTQNSIEEFRESSKEFGNLKDESTKEIYQAVQSKIVSVCVQLLDGMVPSEGAGSFRSGESLSLLQNQPGGLVSKLKQSDVSADHQFQVPTSRPKVVSALGLDRLAQKLRQNNTTLLDMDDDMNQGDKLVDQQQPTALMGGNRSYRKKAEEKDEDDERFPGGAGAARGSQPSHSRDRTTHDVDSVRSTGEDARWRGGDRRWEQGGPPQGTQGRGRGRDSDPRDMKHPHDSNRSRTEDKGRDRGKDRDGYGYGDGDRGGPRGARASVTSTPSRSGIGLDTSEWEEPERLSTMRRDRDKDRPRSPSSASMGGRSGSSGSGRTTQATPLTASTHGGRGSLGGSRKGVMGDARGGGDGSEWDNPTPQGTPMRPPMAGDMGSHGPLSELTRASEFGLSGEHTGNRVTSTPRTALTHRAMYQAGYLVEDTPLPGSSDRRKYFDLRDEDEFDRDFYLSEEGQTSGLEGKDADKVFLGSSKKFQEREEQMAVRRARGDTKIAGMSARRSQLHADQSAWEDNRLLQSGVVVMREVQTEFDSEEDSRVALIVHNLKPPFLDGRVSFSLQQSTVSTVRDPTSDMATNARKGSALLRDVREKREQAKMRKRFWELGGSRMGDAMGIAHPTEEEEKPSAMQVGSANADGDEPGDSDEERVDYKDGSSFAKHIKAQKNVAQSQFARTKTMKEQREYLPVFTVREKLLDVVRENQITVIVGETGSGMMAPISPSCDVCGGHTSSHICVFDLFGYFFFHTFQSLVPSPDVA